jgi:hypothetical protein
MEFQPASEWASLSFIIPKSDQTVRMINDCREVNKRLVRKPFPIPKISTVLQGLEGFTFTTALNLRILMHPKSAPSYFPGKSTLTSDY